MTLFLVIATFCIVTAALYLPIVTLYLEITTLFFCNCFLTLYMVMLLYSLQCLTMWLAYLITSCICKFIYVQQCNFTYHNLKNFYLKLYLTIAFLRFESETETSFHNKRSEWTGEEVQSSESISLQLFYFKQARWFHVQARTNHLSLQHFIAENYNMLYYVRLINKPFPQNVPTQHKTLI